MLNCPTCGYESPENARFCRQCGAPLPAESDPTEATTAHYGRRRPAVAAAGSAPLPPSISDAVAGRPPVTSNPCRRRHLLTRRPAGSRPPRIRLRSGQNAVT
jgi:hypothetical protein